MASGQCNVLSKLSSHFLWQRLCSWFVVKVRLHWGQLHSVPVGCTLFSSSFLKRFRCFNSSKTLSELNNIQCPCAVHTFLSLFQFNLTSHLLWVTCQGALSYFGAFDRRTMRAIISVCRVFTVEALFQFKTFLSHTTIPPSSSFWWSTDTFYPDS